MLRVFSVKQMMSESEETAGMDRYEKRGHSKKQLST